MVLRAYMKWISYDTDSQYLGQGYMPITSTSQTEYERLFLQTVAQQDGFIQFFGANETPQAVYFDDISGLVRRPKVIQQAHYYPFGLPMAKITDLGNPEYAYFFTGKELYEDEALQWYDYGARMYDVQIGRWATHDPEYQDASPYVYCGNNPINFTDPDGRKFFKEIGQGFKEAWQAIGDDYKEIYLENKSLILNVGFAALGIGLNLALPGLGILASAGIMGLVGGLQAGVTSGREGNLLWEDIGVGFGMGAFGGLVGGISARALSTTFLDLGVHAGMALQGAASGAISGTIMGGLSASVAAMQRGEDPYNPIGKGMAIGAGTGLVMGGAMGYATSFRNNAGYEWKSRRVIHRAAKEANRIQRAENAAQKMNPNQDLTIPMQNNGDLKSLVDGSSEFVELRDHFKESSIDVGNVKQATSEGTSLAQTVSSDEKIPFKITVQSSNEKFTRGQYLRAIAHEYSHVYYKFYIYDGSSERREHNFINYNFRGLKTFGF